ncbi:MAG: patatin-like phospholipase family protein [Pseudomonadota bacterium]
MARYRTFKQHLDKDIGPKRILSLDGGGLRGMVSLQVLYRLESLLKERFSDGELRLADYFDLIAGTSTGAIIAAGLSLGMSVEEIEGHYLRLGNKVFMRSFWRRGLLQDSYDASAVAEALRGVYGPGPLKREDFRTGLLVVAKRLDTGSTWVLTNNPDAKYFPPNPARPSTIPNGEYPLWQVVRASTAAPTFFAPEKISIHSSATPGREDVDGFFVDGGCSPHNNPSLQALMTATMDGYRLQWSAGADKLLLVSVGTGKADPAVDTSSKFAGLAAVQGVLALKNLMEDCGDLVETMLQWFSAPTPTSREIDREIGHAGPALGGNALLTYQRYNALFTKKWFKDVLGKDVDAAYLENMQEMDRPENLDALRDLGQAVARQVQPEHLPSVFDNGVKLNLC